MFKYVVSAVLSSLLAGSLQAAPVVFPKQVTLVGPESSQQLVVTADLEQKQSVDLTRTVVYRSSDPAIVTVSGRGLVQPVAEGNTTIVVVGESGERMIPVTVQAMRSPPPVSFRQQIQPVLTKAGCNSGGCHGKAEGQNGFKLSVFGFDDVADHEALVSASRGRRVRVAAPASSLLLGKATSRVPHGGGRKIEEGGLWYQLLRRWMAEGARLDDQQPEHRLQLSIYPAEVQLLAGSGHQLQVFAEDESGQRRCVTREAEFISNAVEVAVVDRDGWVQVDNVPGEAAILARYKGSVAVARVTLPQADRFDRPPVQNEVDPLVWDRLESLGIQPSERTTDAVFLRRVFLDTIGTLPTIEETKQFLASENPAKRKQLIDSLLQRTEYADFWAMKWADILRVDREIIGPVGTVAMTRWLRRQFAGNVPYDQFVQDIVTVRGSTHSETPAAMYVVHDSPEKLARSMSQVFLGVRIECAQCHHHPFERWSQSDYVAFSGFFTGLKQKTAAGGSKKVYDVAGLDLKHPRSGETVSVAGLGSDPVDLAQVESRRVALAQWMTADKNPFLARMLVNRLWSHYLGRGLVEPIDDMRATNPATNEPLLQLLADRFVESGYDVKQLTRLILNSRTYQLSSRRNESNQRDDQNFSRAAWRPMPAEVLLDAICQVTGVQEHFNGWPTGYRAIEIWDNRMPSYFFRVFGKPQRVSVCECERGNEPSISQALHLMNSPESVEKIRHRRGRARKLTRSTLSDDKIVEQLYLAALARYPNAQERELMLGAFREQDGELRRAVVEDVLWALLNTREFVFNH